MKKCFFGLLFFGLLAGTTFQTHKSKSVQKIVTLGYVPPASIVKILGQDLSMLVADWAIVDTMFYYGTLIDPVFSKEQRFKVDYLQLYNHMLRSARLDPYNKDIYYFSQAVFTWEIGRIKEVNALLEHGMQYRAWDEQLPFFAGFNSFYFLKDYSGASDYLIEAYKRSGNAFYARLASRFLRRSGRTEAAIAFLQDQLDEAKDPALRERFLRRLRTFETIFIVEQAVRGYEKNKGNRPRSINDLLTEGYLHAVPKDDFGGKIFLDEKGAVQSESGL